MEKRDIKKQAIAIIILAALLIFSVGYIGYTKYTAYAIQQSNTVAQQAGNMGYEKAIIDVANLAIKCQIVPLTVGNQTINIIDIDCLKQQQSQQSQAKISTP